MLFYINSPERYIFAPPTSSQDAEKLRTKNPSLERADEPRTSKQPSSLPAERLGPDIGWRNYPLPETNGTYPFLLPVCFEFLESGAQPELDGAGEITANHSTGPGGPVYRYEIRKPLRTADGAAWQWIVDLQAYDSGGPVVLDGSWIEPNGESVYYIISPSGRIGTLRTQILSVNIERRLPGGEPMSTPLYGVRVLARKATHLKLRVFAIDESSALPGEEDWAFFLKLLMDPIHDGALGDSPLMEHLRAAGIDPLNEAWIEEHVGEFIHTVDLVDSKNEDAAPRSVGFDARKKKWDHESKLPSLDFHGTEFC